MPTPGAVRVSDSKGGLAIARQSLTMQVQSYWAPVDESEVCRGHRYAGLWRRLLALFA